jgi:hypothetical protein
MAARMRKRIDRAPLKPSKGLEMTVGEVERLPEQQPVPGAIFNGIERAAVEQANED